MSDPQPGDSIPEPWRLTDDEAQILEGVTWEAFPQRLRRQLRREREYGIGVTTKAYRLLAKRLEAERDARKAASDIREEELRAERLEGEETDLAKLRRENCSLRRENQQIQEQARQQARL